MKHTAEEIIAKLGLTKLPEEGGLYRETYRCAQEMHLPHGVRNCCTAIYYLVTPDEFSALHRVASDEIVHFYVGDPVEMFQLWDDGAAQTIRLGSDILGGEFPQVVVPAGVWQGTRLVEGGAWALLGCTVSPGFELADFEAGHREALLAAFPALRDPLLRYTRPER
ncbi:MAG: hypothetical protein CVU65_06980 [Deltaproteobacteria bacterium HGW-Deltaproteobacteria-22]|jgi:hypothetical protein|nr:MAG: hypothetical protein CVU65_06980 [Deltaproteobacteria bacterium HGW-Deltaproteobacteria-22]